MFTFELISKFLFNFIITSNNRMSDTANKVTLGLLGLLAFIGSSNLKLDLGPKGEELIKSPKARKLIVFAIAYLYTRSIKVSLIVTIIYVFVVSVILYEQDTVTAELVEDNNKMLRDIHGVTFNRPAHRYSNYV